MTNARHVTERNMLVASRVTCAVIRLDWESVARQYFIFGAIWVTLRGGFFCRLPILFLYRAVFHHPYCLVFSAFVSKQLPPAPLNYARLSVVSRPFVLLNLAVSVFFISFRVWLCLESTLILNSSVFLESLWIVTSPSPFLSLFLLPKRLVLVCPLTATVGI